MLLAPFAGAARAARAGGPAGWNTGFGPYEVGSSCLLAQPASAAPMEQYLIGRPWPQPALQLDHLGNCMLAQPALPAPVQQYLIGRWWPQSTTYLDQLICDREASHVIDVSVPADWPGAGRLAGLRVPVVLTVLYPTPADNPRPEYTFPDEHGWYRLPHMQRPGEAPLFADERARYPLIVHSGGQNTHGLWHLWKLRHLASHGYVVVDVYHGDGRTPGFRESVALRSLAVRAALDHVLAHPHYAGHIDARRIGATGTSAGGLTVLTLLGGLNPARPGVSLADPRIQVGFGLVPFAGAGLPALPALAGAWNFGEDYAGLAAVKRPWFAVSGELDRNVPAASVLAAARAVGGPAWVVEMKGQTHGMNEAAEAEVRGWESAFFNAHLRHDAAARALLGPGAQPAGADALGRMVLQPA